MSRRFLILASLFWVAFTYENGTRWTPEFDSSAPQNSHIPNGINRLAVLFEILVVARFNQ